MWYPMTAVYYLLDMLGKGDLIEAYVTGYYPKICACRIEAANYVRSLASMVSAGRSSAYRCHQTMDDVTSPIVDCETDQLHLTYDIRSCFESIEWFKCYDDDDLSKKFISKHSNCNNVDTEEFAWTFRDYLDNDHEFYNPYAATWTCADAKCFMVETEFCADYYTTNAKPVGCV